MPTKYKVTAVPFEGYEHFNRAGQTFGVTPTEITVLDEEPAEGAARTPYVVSPKEFDAIKAEPRLKVETMSGKPVEAKPAETPAPTEHEKPRSHR